MKNKQKNNKGPYNNSFYKELEGKFICPCLSGKKYNECHKIIVYKNQDLEIPFNKNYFDFQNQFNRINKKNCVFNNCNNIAISSHTIQRKKYLSYISEENHVVNESRKKSIKININNSGFFTSAKKEGNKTATTFLGFCKNHDAELFKDIEQNDIIPNSNQITLLCYRSICKAVDEMEDIVDLFSKIFKKYISFVKEKNFIHFWTEYYSEYKQKLDIKKQIELSIINCENVLNFVYFNLNFQKNIVCTCLLWDSKDLENKRICSNYAYFDSKTEGALFLIVLPNLKNTIVIFACFKKAIKTNKNILEKLKYLSEKELKSYINFLILNRSDVGVAMRPGWYEKNKDSFTSISFSQKNYNIKENNMENKLKTKDIIWPN